MVGIDFIATPRQDFAASVGRRICAENLRGDAVGLDRRRHAAIHRDQQQDVLHLLAGAAVRQCALGMHREFGGLVAGRGDAEHHQAADVVGETGALPDIAIDIGVDDFLQRRAEFAGRRHPFLDIGIAEHLFAPPQAAGV